MNRASARSHTHDHARLPRVARRAGCAELAQLLLYARASVGQSNSSGYSPLYIASQKGHLECCTTLLNAKADVNQAAKNRATPLL